MAYIARVPVKSHIYLYECESYREDGKVKSRRTLVGKIDPKTEQPVYKEEYIERMRIEGTPISMCEEEKRFSVSDIKNSLVKEIGLIVLFDKIASESGLIDALRMSNPQYCNEIFTIAKHLAANGEPFMHCQEWVEKVEITEEIESMSSQNISKILASLTTRNIEGFYQEWAKKRSEKGLIADRCGYCNGVYLVIMIVSWHSSML